MPSDFFEIYPTHLCASTFYLVSLFIPILFIMVFRILFSIIYSRVKEQMDKYSSTLLADQKERQLKSLDKLMRAIKYFFITQVLFVFYDFLFWKINMDAGSSDSGDIDYHCHTLIEANNLQFLNAIFWLVAKFI